MLRKILLPAIAVATLAGCASGYTYRAGNGDYYYGQPRVEYRYDSRYDPYGYSGSYGYGGGYYYDRYGRLVYISPYNGYYGSPYGYGNGWYSPLPRRHRHGDGHHGHDGSHDADRSERRPPWRNIGGVMPPPAGERDEASRQPLRRSVAPITMPVPPMERAPRAMAPREQRSGGASSSGSPMGRAIREARASAESDGE